MIRREFPRGDQTRKARSGTPRRSRHRTLTPEQAQVMRLAIADSHEDHANMLEWVGGSFSPTAFSLEDTNERLAGIKA